MSDDADHSHTPSAALIVSAFARSSRIAAADLGALLSTVHATLANLGRPAPPARQEPAVPLRRLVTASKVFCAECGKGFKSLKRHLGTSHDLTPGAYIAKWGLKKGHPMVAPEYTAKRSELAKSIGLGRKPAPKPVKAAKAAKAPAKAAKTKAAPKAAAAPARARAPTKTKTKTKAKAKPAAPKG